MIKRIIFLIFILYMNPLFSQEKADPFTVGEDLTYKVKWSFIRLGTLRLQICDTLRMNNEKVYHVKVFIDSNPTLFFINRHSVFETFFSSNMDVHLFRYYEKIDGITYKADYKFNYSDSLIYVMLTDTSDTNNTISNISPFSGKVLDGTSLIYYARINAAETRSDTVRYIADEDQDDIILNFRGKAEPVKIKAMNGLVPSCYMEGRVLNKGIAGLSGYFKGWFSADRRRLPLKAKMKVFIGSVSLILENYKIIEQ